MLGPCSTLGTTSILGKFFRKGILASSLVFSLVILQIPVAHAATTPSLGLAATYAVLASTFTNTSAGTLITGDIGFSTGPAVNPLGTHPNYGSGTPYSTAGIDQGIALAALDSQPCTFIFAPGAINLSTDTTHGPVGVYTPGVYCSSGAMNIGGPLVLSNNGTYIFRPDGALTSTVGANVTLLGASACNVFWTPTQATTLGANTTFAGTVIDDAGITVGANTVWTGLALAFGGTVTTDTNTITVPTCPITTVTIEGGSPLLRRPIISVTKIPSPLALVRPGPITYTYEVSNPGLYTMNNITLTDDKCSPVTYISGDINKDFLLSSNEVWTYNCTTFLWQDTFNTATANGFANGLAATDTAYATVRVGTQVPPPLIHVIKKPNRPLLPFGGGIVKYMYTVTNPGVVDLYSVQVNDDKCSPVIYISGDDDSDNMLDLEETWNYSCKTDIRLTTTNTVISTGKANNLTAIDTAFATVVVAPRPVIVPQIIPVPVIEPPAAIIPVIDPPILLLPVTGANIDIQNFVCKDFRLSFFLRRVFCTLPE